MLSKKFLISQIVFLMAAIFLFMFYHAPRPPLKIIDPYILGNIHDFQLINSENQKVTLKDFKDKIWVADFFFTTCSGICPMLSGHMSRLQKTFKDYPDVKLVSFSVNPEQDNPEALKAYAKKFQADTRQWIFLTGSREEITRLAVGSFKMGDINEPINHSSYFTLVDRDGRIRGYYDTADVRNIDNVIKDVRKLLKTEHWPLLPTINASLNALAGIFLVLGFLAIKRKDRAQHKKLMLCAFASSTLFLCCYLYYHLTSRGITHYQGKGIGKIIYFTILGTHTPLAVLIVPFIIMAIRYALRGEFDKHTKIPRWLYPTWGYVSVTGVLIYLMLYVFPAG